ncbi:hemerythrin domain-containing protein [Nocardia sp. NPDC003345]
MADRDLAMMYAAHNAFRRDLRALTLAPERERWDQFCRQLITHHTAEDTVLWPSLRRRGVAARLIDAMEAEHGSIDPLIARVNTGFQNGVPKTVRTGVAVLSEVLHGHLEHEETEVLPLISEREWALLNRQMRRRIGLRGLSAYYTWLLRDIEGEPRDIALGTIPRPLRGTFARGG